VFQAYNTSGLISSSSPEVAFTVDAGAPAYTTQPTSRTVTSGQDASFVAAASGTPAPTYQWQVSTDGGASFANLTNAAPYSGVTTATLTLTGVTAGLTGARYRAIATNNAGTATSNAAILTVNVAPAITAQPADQVVLAGANVSFAVAVTGTP